MSTQVSLQRQVQGTLSVPNGGTGVSSITGLIKGNGAGAVSPAVSGTDYALPNANTTGTASNVTGIVALANGGTGSATQNFVDLTAAQTVAGVKTFSSTISGSVSGNAATVTTNANLTGDVTSAGNVTTYNNSLPVLKGGTGATTITGTGNNVLSASPIFTGSVTVPTPVNGTDAVNKSYCDGSSQGLSTKLSVVAMSTTNVTLSAAQTIDGTSVVAGNRVLLTGQTTASQNGIWVVQTTAWTRPADFATGSSQVGIYVFVEAGTVNASSGWVENGSTAVVVDTGSSTWTQFSGAGEIVAGTGLTKAGNTLALATPVSLANGGTGSVTQNFVDLTTAQTIAGVKTFSSTVVASVSGNAATVTTNANLTGDVTSVGNVTTLATVTLAKGGTGATTQPGAANAVLPSQGASVGQYLTTNGTNVSWATVAAAVVFTRRTLTGTVNGATTAFTLSSTPNPAGSEQVIQNGIMLNPGAGNDYTISGATVTFAAAPVTGDILQAFCSA